ncbi:MAG TPA: SWIM zinc finger family protein [Ilumatobacter sp.]|nr:SWIM zinc finger family protein [Ilumatobacter sp.]
MHWTEALDDHLLLTLAGPKVVERGRKYFAQGRATIESMSRSTIEAVVDGTDVYEVELQIVSARKRGPFGGIDYQCSCPAAEDGSFCKHCVAVALTARRELDHGSEPAKPARSGPKSTRRTTVTAADIAAHVAAMDHERLVTIVSDLASSDRAFRQRLTDEIRAGRGLGPDVDEWRRRLDAAIRPRRGYVEYHDAATWAAGVERVLDGLRELVDTGHADVVVGLAEHAVSALEDVLGSVDDSDGYGYGLAEMIGELHFDACAAARPDPVALGTRLAGFELKRELDVFYHAAASYADVLGDVGLAAFRAALEPAASAIASDTYGSYRVRTALEGWAIAVGDVDARIDVLSSDLRHAEAYEQIAKILIEVERWSEALAWCRLGLVEMGGRGAAGLSDLTVELLGRPELGVPAAEAAREVDDIRWGQFVVSPSITNCEQWCVLEPGDRAARFARAVDFLRSEVAASRHPVEERQLNDRLIALLLSADDIEAGWQAATQHSCSVPMRREVAERREGTHPADSIDVYEPLVHQAIALKNNGGYADAVALMERIERLAPAAGTPERWERLLHRVRTEHRPKRNLKALLDQHGWPDPRS